MTNQQIQDAPAYKTYLAFAIGVATSKKARKSKKPVSPSKKKALVNKAPTKAKRSKWIELLSKAASLEEAQLKKAIKKSKREINIYQESGSSEGADLESEVLDEPKGKLIDTSEGTGLKPRVPNVFKADSSKSEYETKSDDDKSVDLNKTNDEEKDEFVHTLDDYIPTDDENVDDEEYECINKEMYDDVNVGLKDAKPANEEKGNEEMTHAKNVNAEHKEVIQEVEIDQVKDDAQATTSLLLTILVTVIPESLTAPATTIPLPIPPFIPLPQQSTPIAKPTTTEATISTTSAPDSSNLTAYHQRLSHLEKEVKKLKNVDHSLALRATIKSEVLAAVKEYLGISLDDDLYKTMTASKTFKKHPKHKLLYHALMDSILADKDAMDKGIADIQKKRKPDDADRDEDPPAKPEQRLMRKKTGKDTEQSKKAKSTRTSKGTTKS
nr:hypothetical protein [Tanacetum cinerariifolium]